MKDVADRLRSLKNQIGERAFQDPEDRIRNLEDAVKGIIDIMVEACEEHED